MKFDYNKLIKYRIQLAKDYLALQIQQAQLFAEAENQQTASAQESQSSESNNSEPDQLIVAFGRVIRVPSAHKFQLQKESEASQGTPTAWPAPPTFQEPLQTKWPDVNDNPQEEYTTVQAYGRTIKMPSVKSFQQKVDLEKGQPKTIYVWLLTSVGWVYAGTLTVFKSVDQKELHEMITARYSGKTAEQLTIEATDFEEACKIAKVLIKYGS